MLVIELSIKISVVLMTGAARCLHSYCIEIPSWHIALELHAEPIHYHTQQVCSDSPACTGSPSSASHEAAEM
jgi:hypothetical protein